MNVSVPLKIKYNNKDNIKPLLTEQTVDISLRFACGALEPHLLID